MFHYFLWNNLFNHVYRNLTSSFQRFDLVDHLCENQEEIDCFWNYFTEEGQESMCGWCIDKFGLRWQIIPANMSELMSKSNAGRIMMKQRKIVIAEYL
jgi:predicted 3-demethylubiquinone-9 3-methyltransferase (glyoxalase superfamily)